MAEGKLNARHYLLRGSNECPFPSVRGFSA